jgi:hypothetical protein
VFPLRSSWCTPDIPLSRRNFLLATAWVHVALGLNGCTPRLNWREVRHADGLWRASFPGKPVSFGRDLALRTDKPGSLGEIVPRASVTAVPDGSVTWLPFSLTLWAVVIDEQRYTLGLAQPAAPVEEPLLTRMAHALEAAMVRNIAGDSSITPGVSQTQSGGSPGSQVITATGVIPDASGKTSLPARLQMRTWVAPSFVIEALVVGPQSSFESDAAEQFLSSVVVSSV